MLIKLSEWHSIIIRQLPGGGCEVDFLEDGRRLDTEIWQSLEDALNYYCD